MLEDRSRGFDRFFRLSERGTSLRIETVAGLATWLTMSYVIFANQTVLSSIPDRDGIRLGHDQVVAVTALVAGVMTIVMGLVANRPLAMAAGLGLNSFVAYALVQGQQLSWPEAMGVVVMEGVLITGLVLFGFRRSLIEAIPPDLRKAMAAGTGLFIAFIGLVNAGVVVPGTGTLVGLSSDLASLRILVFVFALLFTTWLLMNRTRGAIPIGILASTLLSIFLNRGFGRGLLWAGGPADVPHRWVAAPDLSLVGKFSFDFFPQLGIATALAVALALMLADFFDTYGTVTGQSYLLDDDGTFPDLKRVLLVDALGAVAGGVASSSTNTTFIESASGISEGGRTGLTSVVVGALFLLAMPFWPVVQVIPPEATGAVLVIIGFLLAKQLKGIEWSDPGIGIPALLTAIVMPFTYSITNGIGIGILSYTVIALLRGRGFQVNWLMYGLSIVFAWYFLHGLLA